MKMNECDGVAFSTIELNRSDWEGGRLGVGGGRDGAEVAFRFAM